MLLQSYFPFPVIKKKTTFPKKINSNFLHLLLAFTKIFVFNDGQITKGRKSLDEMSELHCFKTLSTNFHVSRKEE